ncbi:hypothetical protein [Bacillus sp. NPDC077027]|uniref:hypothetical protein n=1 Tax=Bacillus sp. NPDC077027 TaxID=3390548 RepID=UPI003D05C61F
MKFKVKLLYSITFFLFLFSIVYGFIVKASLKDDVHIHKSLKEFDSFIVSNDDASEYTDIYFNNNIVNVDNLFAKSELVVVGKIADKRLNYNQAIKSEFKIEKILKSDSDENNQLKKILVFEPSYFSFDTYNVQSGYNLMESNRSYLLFLKHLKTPKGYKYKKDEEITYMPVSTFYSKYVFKTKKDNTKLISAQALNNLKYREIKDYDLLTSDAEIFNMYKTLKNELLKRGMVH